MADAAFTAVPVGASPDGLLTYLLDLGPEQLPAVQAADLARAWRAAGAAAAAAAWGRPRALVFRRGDGGLQRLSLADDEARCWAGAVERTLGLDTVYGLAVCVRLLALVDLLARAAWLRHLFDLEGGAAEFHPALLGAAASCVLDTEARLDEGAMRARLARIAARPAPRAAPPC